MNLVNHLAETALRFYREGEERLALEHWREAIRLLEKQVNENQILQAK